MLTKWLARRITTAALALILGLGSVISFTQPAQAKASLDLMLDNGVSTGWNIGNIKPGDKGTEVVPLHNAGTSDGYVMVWVSDIVSSEGLNPESETGDTTEPGELDKYLLFDLSCIRLATDLSLPVTINNLPQSVTDRHYMVISPLLAGETINLTWNWEFINTVAPQNDAQGDSLSFTINYLLQTWTPGSGGGGGTGTGGGTTEQQLDVDILGNHTLTGVNASGELLAPLVVTDPHQEYELDFSKGTKISDVDGQFITKIEMKAHDAKLSSPQGTEIIGQAFDLIGYVHNIVVPTITFNKSVKLTLSYDLNLVSGNISRVYLAGYNNAPGWVALETLIDSDTEPGKITALINQSATFAILAELKTVNTILNTPTSVAPTTLASIPLETMPTQPVISDTILPPEQMKRSDVPNSNISNKQPNMQHTANDYRILRLLCLSIIITGVIALVILVYIRQKKRPFQEGEPA